ncbi:uncharacterized protein [Hetaerina americana]|uniref:uncharacterized protein n=1 Tax=Hetaerina americana TaxID=62018 RepID=UPI003A7F54DB
MDVQGKVALITGGARGIGLACAKELLRKGCSVAICDINALEGEVTHKALAAEFGPEQVIYIRGDITKDDQFEEAFKKTKHTFSGLDIVVNNAGIFDEKRYERMIAVNVTSTGRGTALAMKYLGKDNGGKGGVVVNIASVLGLKPYAGCPMYCATKHAIIGLSRTYGEPMYFNASGVRVVTVCPGMTATDMLHCDAAVEMYNRYGIYIEDVAKQLPHCVGLGVAKVIAEASSGSVWIVEDGEPVYEVKIPDYSTYRKSTGSREASRTTVQGCGGRSVHSIGDTPTSVPWVEQPQETADERRKEGSLDAQLGSGVERVSTMDLEGKVAFLTGGAGGLGQCMTRSLLGCGVSVVLFDLSKEKGDAFQRQMEEEYEDGKVHFICGDVTKKEDFESAFSEAVNKYSRIDIMINNAGIMNDEHWEAEIDINLKALVRGTNIALAHMSKANGGSGGMIINMSSVLGLIPLQLTPVYTATKFAVIGFTRAHGYQNQYDKTGVRVIALCPGHTETELVTKGSFGTVLQKFLSRHHKGDKEHLPQKPDAVGNAVPFLLNDAPTGSIWVVEGGGSPYQISIPHYRDFKTAG